LTCPDNYRTFLTMNRKPGRPPAKVKRDSDLELRVSADEKEAFELAAAMAGISLSSWVRERLRLAAIRELESAGRRVPFVPDIPLGGSND
jgi:predicted HicB family RNase H-like nuclease